MKRRPRTRAQGAVDLPAPYVGMTLRRGKGAVNVHDIKNGVVYYGKYDDDAHDAPEHCIALLQMPLAEFEELAHKAVNIQGAKLAAAKVRKRNPR